MKITPRKLVWSLIVAAITGFAIYLISRKYPDQTFLAILMLLAGWILAGGLSSGSIAFGRGRDRLIDKALNPVGYWLAVIFYAVIIGVLAWMMFIASTRGLRGKNEKVRADTEWSSART